MRYDRQIASRLMSDLQRDFGFTREQAAGFVGNLAHESGGFKTLQETNPTVAGSRGGYGYAQWTGPRRDDYEAWAERNGLDPASYEANYGFIKHELNGKERGALTRIKSANTVKEAAKATEKYYERPGIKHSSSRVAYANDIFDRTQGVGIADAEIPTPTAREGILASLFAPPSVDRAGVNSDQVAAAMPNMGARIAPAGLFDTAFAPQPAGDIQREMLAGLPGALPAAPVSPVNVASLDPVTQYAPLNPAPVGEVTRAPLRDVPATAGSAPVGGVERGTLPDLPGNLPAAPVGAVERGGMLRDAMQPAPLADPSRFGGSMGAPPDRNASGFDMMNGGQFASPVPTFADFGENPAFVPTSSNDFGMFIANNPGEGMMLAPLGTAEPVTPEPFGNTEQPYSGPYALSDRVPTSEYANPMGAGYGLAQVPVSDGMGYGLSVMPTGTERIAQFQEQPVDTQTLTSSTALTPLTAPQEVKQYTVAPATTSGPIAPTPAPQISSLDAANATSIAPEFGVDPSLWDTLSLHAASPLGYGFATPTLNAPYTPPPPDPALFDPALGAPIPPQSTSGVRQSVPQQQSRPSGYDYFAGRSNVGYDTGGGTIFRGEDGQTYREDPNYGLTRAVYSDNGISYVPANGGLMSGGLGMLRDTASGMTGGLMDNAMGTVGDVIGGKGLLGSANSGTPTEKGKVTRGERVGQVLGGIAGGSVLGLPGAVAGGKLGQATANFLAGRGFNLGGNRTTANFGVNTFPLAPNAYPSAPGPGRALTAAENQRIANTFGANTSTGDPRSRDYAPAAYDSIARGETVGLF